VIKDEVYKVTSIGSCSCGRTKLSLIGKFIYVSEYSTCWCGSTNGGVHDSSRFAPLLTDSIKFAEETLEKVKEHIDTRELILNN